jgi:hypothetical protein
MDRSHELVAGQRHAHLLAEAAQQRFAAEKRPVAGETEPAGRRRARRLLLRWGPIPAR